MIKIKVTGVEIPILRQTIGGDGLWNDDYKFYYNDLNITKCDYWFIFDESGLNKDNIAECPKENIYFVMGEVERIRTYNKYFVKQFYNIVTAQKKKYNVPKVYYRYLAPWFVGLKFTSLGLEKKYSGTYDELSKIDKIDKTKLISVIASNKQLCDGHIARLNFARSLQDYFGKEVVDLYGRGINDFVDKWDILAPYKYHIAIENQAQKYYITEKLHDPFLALSYPIYYGAPNVKDYFNDKSFSVIDINNIGEAINTIEKILRDDVYEERLDYIKESRKRVLEEYNIFAEMVRIIKENDYSRDVVVNRLHQEKYYKRGKRIHRILEFWKTEDE